MDVGYYTNVFEVSLADENITFMEAEHSRYQDLRKLRASLKRARVYADRDTVYGYGKDLSELEPFEGFTETSRRFTEVPTLASRMILEGYLNELTSNGFELRYQLPLAEALEGRKGRVEVFSTTPIVEFAAGQVKLFKGYDLRAIYLRDPQSDELSWCLVIDATFTQKDGTGSPIPMPFIRQTFGEDIYRQIRIKQGDILPNGRINSEASRAKLLEHILPLVKQFDSFDLANGTRASVSRDPARVSVAVTRGV